MRPFRPFGTQSFDLSIEKYGERYWVVYVRMGDFNHKIGHGVDYQNALVSAAKRLAGVKGFSVEEIEPETVPKEKYEELERKFDMALTAIEYVFIKIHSITIKGVIGAFIKRGKLPVVVPPDKLPTGKYKIQDTLGSKQRRAEREKRKKEREEKGL